MNRKKTRADRRAHPRLAGVNYRDHVYVVASYNKDVDGIWFLNGYVARLSDESPAEELGAAIKEALAVSAPMAGAVWT
jgi:hypothetical protein